METKEVQAESSVKEKDTQPAEKVQEEEEEEEVMKMKHVVHGDREQRREAKELVGGSLCSPCVSQPPSCPLKNIDSIVDKNLVDFSSEIQLVLQEESVHYSFPQSPHSTSNTDATALPQTPISQFSPYVSFYNPCPPVQNYVNSLQDSINSMLTELDGSWPNYKPDTSQTNTDAALASKVSAFVSSIRAANAANDGLCGEPAAADLCTSVSQTPAASREGDMWQPHTVTRECPDATKHSNSQTSHFTVSVPTSTSGSVYNPNNTAVLHHPPNMSPQSHWKPQQSHTLEINRTVSHNIRQVEDNSIPRTVHCTAGVKGGSSCASTNSEVTLPGFHGVSKPLMEPTHPSEPVSSPASVSVPGPASGPTATTADLSSLISQLQPEVFNSLVEIIKDVKRNSVQFYIHSTGSEDQVYEDVKEHLLKQGNTEQSPVAFLNQENSDSRLLVIIKNKDISGHIHKIPGLMSLKRHPTVVFVGIDTLDDIRNNSYNELFVSGGCIVSDELVLNPDFITHDRLAALLMSLEQHSSPESVWRWKVHYKTQKKLKEQARFKRDAANLLNILSAYQKRQIVEFLPYHHCDSMNHQSPDLDCLMELQARYTQYRHTVLLTEQHLEKFLAYSKVGIIVASIEEMLNDFGRLVDYHDLKNNQPITEDMLAPKEHTHSLSSCDRPQHLLQQSSSSLPPLSHLSDQLVPDTSYKESVPYYSGKDLEDLRLAISHLRAERQADSQAELINPIKTFLPNPIHTGNRKTPPPVGQEGLTESLQLTPGKKAVAATLELIHSGLQPELREEEKKKVRGEGQWSGGSQGGPVESGDQRDGTPVRVVGLLEGNLGPSNSDTCTSSSNQNAAAVTGLSNHADSTSDRREKADQQGEPAFPKTAKYGAASSSTTAFPVVSNRSRGIQLRQESPIREEGAPPLSSTVETASGTKVTGSTTVVVDQEDNPNPAVLHLQQIQQPQRILQQQKNQQQPLNEPHRLQQSLSHLQQPPHSQQQQWGGLLQPPHMPRPPIQPFSHGPLLGPLTVLGGGLLGPTPVWPGGLGPTGPAALVWGFQQPGRDFTGSGLLGAYHNPAGQGGNRYRGGQRGGGFNGM